MKLHLVHKVFHSDYQFKYIATNNKTFHKLRQPLNLIILRNQMCPPTLFPTLSIASQLSIHSPDNSSPAPLKPSDTQHDSYTVCHWEITNNYPPVAHHHDISSNLTILQEVRDLVRGIFRSRGGGPGRECWHIFLVDTWFRKRGLWAWRRVVPGCSC